MRRKAILYSILLSLLMVGCSREADAGDVDKAAAQFFDRVKSAKYDDIYNDASKPFREQNAKITVLDNLKQLASRGRIQSYQRLSMILDREGENSIALPVYSVMFDGASKQVTFKFVDEGGEWKLLGFSLLERGGAPAQS